MATTTTDDLILAASGQASKRAAMRRRAWLTLMVAGCVLASGLVLAWPLPPETKTVDPALAALLHGMALIKLALVAAMGGLLGWRFGRPMSRLVAFAYLACVWTATAATVLIWQSASLVLASVLFHGAGLAFVLLGLRDDRVLPAFKALPGRR